MTTGVGSRDELLFAELVRRHGHELRAHAYRMLGSQEDAEELVQETFLRAWRNRHAFRGDASFRAWLYRIATNTGLSALEARTRRRETLVAPDGPDTDRLVGPDFEPKETIDLALLAAIRHLPVRQRAVLFLRLVLGWSARDTAELLQTSVASVNSALQRARATVRAELGGRPTS